MAYFVSYEITRQGERSPDLTLNVILRRTHPITWAANPPEAARASGLNTRLLFWTEIPDEVIDEAVERSFNVED